VSKVCVVLGAGATLANALHFHPKRMRHTWPPLDTSFFETVEGLEIDLPPAVDAYLRTLMGEDPPPEQVRKLRMEEFFKDVFFDFQDDPVADGAAHVAYVQLVDLYAGVLTETTNWLCSDRGGAPVGRLLAAVGEPADSLTVITFNHDLVIESEIFRRARLRSRWCLSKGYGTFGDELRRTDSQFPGEQVFPSHSDDCNHGEPITILKLHGSLNWAVRLASTQPTPDALLGLGGRRNIYLMQTRKIQPRVLIGRETGPGGPGRQTWNAWPVIIPPIYSKQALRARIQPVWTDARRALEACDRLIFFGYSLPQIDIEAEKLFERGIATNDSLEWADVINPAPAAAQRYAGLAPAIPVRWYSTVDKFMAGERGTSR
jgi:hypothetical protein